jgi:hypothetical protein
MNMDDFDLEMRDRLWELGVYNVDAYGWKNADEVDPDYVGYAMWTLDAPYEHASVERQGGHAPERRASAEQQRLIELGEDLHGVMKSARHEIGLALAYRNQAAEHLSWESHFECHVICALMLLKIATDRARDFVIIAALGELPRMNREYDQFRLALCVAEQRGMSTVARDLRNVAAMTDALRDRRNAVVHKMTMDRTRVHSYLIEEERQAHDAGKWPRRRPDDAKIRRYLNATIAPDRPEAERDVERSLRTLAESYEMVIKIGDLAFRLENGLRHRG